MTLSWCIIQDNQKKKFSEAREARLMNQNASGDGQNDSVPTPGDGMERQMLRLAAWPGMAGVIFLAMSFRFRGEPGGLLVPYEDGPVSWRPDIFDLPYPYIAVVIVCALLRLFRRSNFQAGLFDISRVGSLLCLSLFAISKGSATALYSAIAGIWLCSFLTAKKGEERFSGLSTAAAGIMLIFSCIVGAYMQVQTGCTAFEAFLIILAAACGFLSAEPLPVNSLRSRLVFSAWFTLLPATFITTAGPYLPPLRLLMLLELSAAFIVGRQIAINRNQADQDE